MGTISLKSGKKELSNGAISKIRNIGGVIPMIPYIAEMA